MIFHLPALRRATEEDSAWASAELNKLDVEQLVRVLSTLMVWAPWRDWMGQGKQILVLRELGAWKHATPVDNLWITQSTWLVAHAPCEVH